MTAYPDPFRIDLEDYCVLQPYESSWNAPFDGQFHTVRPAVSRKIYPSSKKPRRIYMGAVLEPRNELRRAKEIATMVDKRPISQLLGQAADALGQMLYRAHCGDKEAIQAYVLASYHAVASLQTLTKHQPVKVQGQAEMFSHWPVLLSLNPQDISDAKQHLKSLGVSTKSLLPTRPGQRVNYRHHWTQLALLALTACARNKVVVPAMKALCAGAKSERKTMQLWGTQLGATFYQLANGDVVVIADWQAQCTKLSSKPISEQNFEQWWSVMEPCILEYWRNPMGNYAEAISRIRWEDTPEPERSGQNHSEARKRAHAIHQIKRALRPLVGLPVRQKVLPDT